MAFVRTLNTDTRLEQIMAHVRPGDEKALRRYIEQARDPRDLVRILYLLCVGAYGRGHVEGHVEGNREGRRAA